MYELLVGALDRTKKADSNSGNKYCWQSSSSPSPLVHLTGLSHCSKPFHSDALHCVCIGLHADNAHTDQ